MKFQNFGYRASLVSRIHFEIISKHIRHIDPMIISKQKAPYRVYCMMGDGECAEGSVWEAMQYSGHYKLDNLCAIIDCNRLGQSEATALGHEMETYR